MKYRAIYEKTATGYSAYAPDLPGCITTGPTLEETERLMKEAIEFHLEWNNSDQHPYMIAVGCAATAVSITRAADGLGGMRLRAAGSLSRCARSQRRH
jgi:predicted RNase H-like HicB family nuclease